MVQLTHSHPSHLIAPAIHLTKEDAAAVFGVEPTVEAIQAEARRSLREKFINASVGISGANAAIAETGTVMIVTNEGNADLTVTLPQVHIALFGIDKIVATLDDATSMLRMLPRSGTGQRISSYVNFVTGPSRSADIEQSLTIGVHGPREMHCVVLDNGRTAMREDPIMRAALTCVRCGACSNACPPFMAVSGHQFGHIYNGPIGLVLTPFHHGHKVDDFPNSLCVQCNACQEICPVDIPLPRQILEHRRSARKPLWKTGMLDLWSSTLADPALRLAAPFSRLVPGAPAALATKPFRDRVKPGGSGEAATIFASCLVDRMWPQAGVALERLGSAAGFKVGFPKEQWCCGLIAANAGEFKTGAAAVEGQALLKRGTIDLSLLDERVEALCTKLLYTFPDCTTKTVEELRKPKLSAWNTNKENARDWLALNMMTEARAGFRAFNEGTRETGREVDFVALRRALAANTPWSDELSESIQPRARG